MERGLPNKPLEFPAFLRSALEAGHASPSRESRKFSRIDCAPSNLVPRTRGNARERAREEEERLTSFAM